MKQIKARTKSKLIILVNLFLILTLMTVTVYSWFAAHADNRVDIYEIQVESKNALELSFDEETWSGSLNLNDLTDSDGNKVMDTLKLVEITGDGNSFRIPQLTQKTEYAEVNKSGTWSEAAPNNDYLDFTVYMRSKDPLNVYLSSDSAAVPTHTVLEGENCENPSSYAKGENAFSKDFIVGALRVSYLNSANTRKIWITNPKFHLTNDMGDSEYEMDTEATATKYATGSESNPPDAPDTHLPFYWNNPYRHYYYDDSRTIQEMTTNVITELPETVTEEPESADTKIAVLSGTPDDGYFTGKVTFRIWIEGCDTEARRALGDGSFSLSLVFDAFEIS